jgi:hypothetical protein
MSIVLAIGTRKGLWLAHELADGTWKVDGPHFSMREVPSVAFGPAAASSDGVPRLLVGVRSEHWGPGVVRSDDLGGRWDETDQGSVRFDSDTGAALERVWQIHPDPYRPGVVWAGCEPTSVWRSTDGGEHFRLVRGLWDHPHRKDWAPGAGGAAVHTIVTDPADGDRAWVAMSTGGVYVTDDGGASWQPRNRGISAGFVPGEEPEYGQCVHKIAPDAAGPSRLYAQNHGGVYRTDDAGLHWVSIADGLPADFGFPILAHPSRPAVAWVVPLVADGERFPPGGRLRLQRTDDAGTSWREVGEGLPESCWNAVLRDAATVLASKPNELALLAIGTRDGCVYASTDEGETFSEVAAHLPDVLSVRAAAIG